VLLFAGFVVVFDFLVSVLVGPRSTASSISRSSPGRIISLIASKVYRASRLDYISLEYF
jgi:hypothetical protein